MDGGFMLLVLAVVVGWVLYSAHASKKVTVAWSAAAKVLQLSHVPGGWMQERRLSGKIDGRLVVIETFTRGSGKNSSKHTRYRVQHAQPLRLELNLRKQGFFSGVVKAFGAQDIQVGDPAFDERFMIKGMDPRAVVHYLSKSRRDLIWQAVREFDDLTLDDGGVQSEFPGEEETSHTLVRRIRRLVEFVRALEGGHAPSPSADLPTVTYAMPVQPARPTHRPPPLPGPPPLPTPVPAQREKTPALRQGPSSGRSAERSGKNTRPPETLKSQDLAKHAPPEQADRPEVVSSPSHSVPAHEVGALLFGMKSGIADSERTFAADFAGREIEGQGVVRHAKATDFDFVLGSGTFVKATVDVPLPAGDAYGRSTFQVIVRLPAGTSCPAIGETMAFRGRLLKMDGLMRQLHVRSE